MRLHIPVLEGAEKGRITGYNNGHIKLKTIPLRLNFQDESHLYANCLFFVLITYVCSDILAATKIFIYC